MFEAINIEELSEVEREKATPESETLFCTVDQCEGQLAVCFCVTCDYKFCADHLKVKQL